MFFCQIKLWIFRFDKKSISILHTCYKLILGLQNKIILLQYSKRKKGKSKWFMKENCHDNLYFSPRGLSLVLAFQKNPKSRKKVAHTYILYNIWSLCWKIQNAIFCVAPDKSWFDKVNFFGGKSGKSTWDFWKLCSVTPWPHSTRFL